MTVTEKTQLKLVEATIRMWILEGIPPSMIGIGLNNAFVHGEIFDDAAMECSEDTLKELYQSIDSFMGAASKIK